MTELGIDEQAALEDRRRSARQADADAHGLELATAAIRVLAGGLSDEARTEVFTGILKRLDSTSGVPDRPTQLGLMADLAQAGDLVEEKAQQEAGIAAEAEKSARHIQENGLPR